MHFYRVYQLKLQCHCFCTISIHLPKTRLSYCWNEIISKQPICYNVTQWQQLEWWMLTNFYAMRNGIGDPKVVKLHLRSRFMCETLPRIFGENSVSYITADPCCSFGKTSLKTPNLIMMWLAHCLENGCGSVA